MIIKFIRMPGTITLVDNNLKQQKKAYNSRFRLFYYCAIRRLDWLVRRSFVLYMISIAGRLGEVENSSKHKDLEASNIRSYGTNLNLPRSEQRITYFQPELEVVNVKMFPKRTGVMGFVWMVPLLNPLWIRRLKRKQTLR